MELQLHCLHGDVQDSITYGHGSCQGNMVDVRRFKCKTWGVAQFVLSPHSKKVSSSNMTAAFLRGVYMFSLCMSGFVPHSPAFSHSGLSGKLLILNLKGEPVGLCFSSACVPSSICQLLGKATVPCDPERNNVGTENG